MIIDTNNPLARYLKVTIRVDKGREVVTNNCFKIDLKKGRAAIFKTKDGGLIPVLDGKAMASYVARLAYVELETFDNDKILEEYIALQKKYPFYLR